MKTLIMTDECVEHVGQWYDYKTRSWAQVETVLMLRGLVGDGL